MLKFCQTLVKFGNTVIIEFFIMQKTNKYSHCLAMEDTVKCYAN